MAIDFKKLMNQPRHTGPRELFISTCQMSKVPKKMVRVVDRFPCLVETAITNVWFVDTTSAARHPLFQPGWDIVKQHKSGKITDARYTKIYKARMRQSFTDEKDKWLELLRAAYEEEHWFVLVCYCNPTNFCHRHLLKDIILKVCRQAKIPARYMGEWST